VKNPPFLSPEILLPSGFIFGALLLAFGVLWFLRRREWKKALDYRFLEVRIPRFSDDENSAQKKGENEMKETLGVSTQFFRALHSAIPTATPFSAEMVVRDGELRFLLAIPQKKVPLLEKQLTSFFPGAAVEPSSDPNIFSAGSAVAAGLFKQEGEGILPLRTFEQMESDPLSHLTNAFSKLTEDEGATLQLLFQPAEKGWQAEGKKKAKEILSGKKPEESKPALPIRALIFLLKVITLQIEDLGEEKEGKEDLPEKTTPQEEELAKAIGAKASDRGFRCWMRLLVAAPEKETAEGTREILSNSFSQFSALEGNSLEFREVAGWRSKKKERAFVKKYLFRQPGAWEESLLLSSEELASIFHFPDPALNKSPVIKWQNSRTAGAPVGLAKEGILIGDNFFRGEKKEIRISPQDRFRHFYIVGQTGTGKSVGMTNMILQDLEAGHGICVMDPHGSLAKDVLDFVPKERAEDVIYFNPADTERPMGMNLLEAETAEEKDLVTLDALTIMIKLFGEEIFSPRLQDYFRNGALTLLDSPDGGSLVDVVALFTNKAFLAKKRTTLKNPVVADWWENTFDKTSDREKADMLPYFASKFGAFITNTTMRNILGQAKSAFDFGKAMQEKKIILINLAKGLIGEQNSNLLGMIVTSKIQMAAMQREKMPKEQRVPFFFYIDEFQNFITEAIESILSEARKYKLGMIMAHQYISQLEQSGGLSGGTGDKIKKAVFGNVGSIWSYRVSPEDAEYLEESFKPVFTRRDIVNLDVFNACFRTEVDGVSMPPFSVRARKYWEDPEVTSRKNSEKTIKLLTELSRLKWGRPKPEVDAEVLERLGLIGEEAEKRKAEKLAAEERRKAMMASRAGGAPGALPGRTPPKSGAPAAASEKKESLKDFIARMRAQRAEKEGGEGNAAKISPPAKSKQEDSAQNPTATVNRPAEESSKQTEKSSASVAESSVQKSATAATAERGQQL
jgi:hypothetical protein